MPDDPTAPAVACTPGNVTDSVTEVVSAGNSGLNFDPSTLVYTFVWKTTSRSRAHPRLPVQQVVPRPHHLAAALRQAAGGEPVARLNARLNAASDS